MSRDREFVLDTLKPMAASDDFIKNLLDIYETQSQEEINALTQVGIHRCDYMLNWDGKKDHALQVEMNTIASSFGCLSQRVGNLHRYLVSRACINPVYRELFPEPAKVMFLSDEFMINAIPENPSIQSLAKCISEAKVSYGNKDAAVLFVVQPGELNVSGFTCDYCTFDYPR
jgi:glutathione synthase